MLKVSEVERWLRTLPPSSFVAVDEGGLTLVHLTAAGEKSPAYLEVGGEPEEGAADERFDRRQQRGPFGGAGLGIVNGRPAVVPDLGDVEPLRVLVTCSGGCVHVDRVPVGVTVEVRDFDGDGEGVLASEIDAALSETPVQLERTAEGDYVRADRARPEFDTYPDDIGDRIDHARTPNGCTCGARGCPGAA